MAITTVPSAVTGQTLSAANWNTQVRDNINGFFVFTTAGDMIYATGASALARLALVVGGIMYGGASAPAWLAAPSVDSLLKNTVAGTPSYLAITAIPGRIQAIGSNFTNSLAGTITTASYVSIGAGLKFTLTLTSTCTIIAWATGLGLVDVGSHGGYFALAINGTIDPNENIWINSTSKIPFACMYKATSIPSGSREVELKFRAVNAADPVRLFSGYVHAIAIVE